MRVEVGILMKELEVMMALTRRERKVGALKLKANKTRCDAAERMEGRKEKSEERSP